MYYLVHIPSLQFNSDPCRHLNIGAGRIVWQDIVRIDVSIKKRQFHKTKAIVDSFKKAKDGNGRLHLLGLVNYSLNNHKIGPLMLRRTITPSRSLTVVYTLI